MQLKVTHMHLIWYYSRHFVKHLAIAIYGVQSMRWVTLSLDRVRAIYAAVFLCSKARPKTFILTVHGVAAVLSVVVVVVFTLKTVLTSIQYPSLSYSSRQRNEFPWSQANPK